MLRRQHTERLTSERLQVESAEAQCIGKRGVDHALCTHIGSYEGRASFLPSV